MNSPIKTRHENTHEDICEMLTAWIREPGKSRSQSMDVNTLGCIVKLFERGTLQATGRGRCAEDAIEDALADLGISGPPDAAEEEFNRTHEGAR